MIVSTDIFCSAIDLKNKLDLFPEKLDDTAEEMKAAIEKFLNAHSI